MWCDTAALLLHVHTYKRSIHASLLHRFSFSINSPPLFSSSLSLSHLYKHTQVLVCPFVCVHARVCVCLYQLLSKLKLLKNVFFLLYVRCVSVVCLHFNRLALLSHYLFNSILFGSWVTPCIRTLDFILCACDPIIYSKHSSKNMPLSDVHT